MPLGGIEARQKLVDRERGSCLPLLCLLLVRLCDAVSCCFRLGFSDASADESERRTVSQRHEGDTSRSAPTLPGRVRS